MSCSLHPLFETPEDCKICYMSWPSNIKRTKTRAECKRLNWVGNVDANYKNRSININNEFLKGLVK